MISRERDFDCMAGMLLLWLAIRLVVLAAIIDLTAHIVPGIHVSGGFAWLLWVAVIFSVINLILGPLFRLLSLPFIILTLGLFLLVVNAALLAITAGISSHLAVDNFGSAVLGGIAHRGIQLAGRTTTAAGPPPRQAPRRACCGQRARVTAESLLASWNDTATRRAGGGHSGQCRRRAGRAGPSAEDPAALPGRGRIGVRRHGGRGVQRRGPRLAASRSSTWPRRPRMALLRDYGR